MDSAEAENRLTATLREHRQVTDSWQRIVLQVMMRSAARVQRMTAAEADAFGSNLGRVAWRVASRARRQAHSNLALAYGDSLTPRQRHGLVRRVFKHFGRATVSFLRAPLWTPDALRRDISCEGWENVARARELGRGLVFVSGHIGNWEILARWFIAVQGMPLTVVAREPENPALGDYLRRTRESGGLTVLSKGDSARDLLRTLRNGESVSLLPDQNSGDLFLPFFSVPAGTVAGPASIALHTGAPLFAVFCVRRSDGGFHVICRPEIVVPPEITDKSRRTEWMMRSVNGHIEAAVREFPDQWLWLHNRWKSAFETKNRERAWGTGEASDRAFREADRRRRFST